MTMMMIIIIIIMTIIDNDDADDCDQGVVDCQKIPNLDSHIFLQKLHNESTVIKCEIL